MANAQIERVKELWSTINDRLIRSSDGRRPERPSVWEALKGRLLRLIGRAPAADGLEGPDLPEAPPELLEAPPLELDPEVPLEPSPARALNLATIKEKLRQRWSSLHKDSGAEDAGAKDSGDKGSDIKHSGRRLDWTTISQMLRPPTVALSFEDGLVRVVVLQGRKVVAWSVVQPWTPPASDTEAEKAQEGSPSNEAGEESPDIGEAACIRALLVGLRIRKCRTITDVPLYASLLRHLTLPVIQHRRERGKDRRVGDDRDRARRLHG